MEKKRTSAVIVNRKEKVGSSEKVLRVLLYGTILSFLLSPTYLLADTAASSYNPPWAIGELNWVSHGLFARPYGSTAYWDNNSPASIDAPWWQANVAHPIKDYGADALSVGSVRLDPALDAEVTFHRLERGWSKRNSPPGIDNVYTFTPGSKSQEDQTARAGPNALLDFGLHPI